MTPTILQFLGRTNAGSRRLSNAGKNPDRTADGETRKNGNRLYQFKLGHFHAPRRLGKSGQGWAFIS